MSEILAYMKANEREFESGFLADNASIGLGRFEKGLKEDKKTLEYIKCGVELCNKLEKGYKKKNGKSKEGIQIKDLGNIITFDIVLRTKVKRGEEPTKVDEEKLLKEIQRVRRVLEDALEGKKLSPDEVNRCQTFFLGISNISLARTFEGVRRIESAVSLEGR